jgi:hypothetical protein
VKQYERLRRQRVRELYARWQQQLHEILLSDQPDWIRLNALHHALMRIEHACSPWLFEEQKEESR